MSVAGEPAHRLGSPGGAPAPYLPFESRHAVFRDEVRAYVATELAPHADEWEAAEWFPDSVLADLGARGWLGLRFPVEDGGAGDPLAAAVFVEELARCGSGGLAAGIGAHCGIALPPISAFGTPAQKARFLAPGLRGERIAALAITEPGAGSDVASIATRATPVDGGWRVDGQKVYITGGCRARTLVTAVRTTQAGGHHGLSFLIIEADPDVAGITRRPLSKLGWHASDTAELTFDDVFVPTEQLLGEENGGFYLIMANFAWERLLMSLGAVGVMAYCLQLARPLSRGAADDARLDELDALAAAARSLTYAALASYVAGADSVAIVTQAKLLSQRSAVTVAEVGLDLAARAGSPTERWERTLRDARLGPIGGGTDEIMKEILGRSLGL